MRSLLTALLASATLAVGGCGGDDGDSGSGSSNADDGAPTGQPLGKAAYIVEADKICKDVDAATQAYEDQVDDLPDNAAPRRVGEILKGGLEQTKRGVTRLKALEAPSEERATLDQYFASIDKSIVLYDDLLTALTSEDQAEARKIATEADPLFDDQRRLAQAYGFKECRSV